MRVPTVRGVLLFAFVWIAITAMAIVDLWPIHPSSIGGWVLFVVLGPPLFVLGLGAAEWAWSTRLGKFISEHPSRPIRIALGVVVIGLATAILSVAWIAIDHWTGHAVV
jgi:hypothetical protein